MAFLDWMASDAERARSLTHVRLASRTFRAQTQLTDWCADDDVASMLRRLDVQGVDLLGQAQGVQRGQRGTRDDRALLRGADPFGIVGARGGVDVLDGADVHLVHQPLGAFARSGSRHHAPRRHELIENFGREFPAQEDLFSLVHVPVRLFFCEQHV